MNFVETLFWLILLMLILPSLIVVGLIAGLIALFFARALAYRQYRQQASDRTEVFDEVHYGSNGNLQTRSICDER